MKDYSLISKHLKSFSDSLQNLKNVGIIRNKKDFTCQLGEWLVSEIYDGVYAESSIQKDWDIRIGAETFVQVKTHAKAIDNKNRWTGIRYQQNAKIDELIIIVFTHEYKLKEFYKIPWSMAIQKIKNEKARMLIYWNHVSEFRIPVESLPKRELVNLFL